MTQVKSTTLFAIEALHGVTNAACLRQRPRRPSPASGLSPDTERDHPLVKDLAYPIAAGSVSEPNRARTWALDQVGGDCRNQEQPVGRGRRAAIPGDPTLNPLIPPLE